VALDEVAARWSQAVNKREWRDFYSICEACGRTGHDRVLLEWPTDKRATERARDGWAEVKRLRALLDGYSVGDE
jgi:hypothetical protein